MHRFGGGQQLHRSIQEHAEAQSRAAHRSWPPDSQPSVSRAQSCPARTASRPKSSTCCIGFDSCVSLALMHRRLFKKNQNVQRRRAHSMYWSSTTSGAVPIPMLQVSCSAGPSTACRHPQSKLINKVRGGAAVGSIAHGCSCRISAQSAGPGSRTGFSLACGPGASTGRRALRRGCAQPATSCCETCMGGQSDEPIEINSRVRHGS